MHTTSTGKIKVGLALDPHAYELLKQMAAGPRAVGALLGGLICAEAARRESVEREQNSDQELYQTDVLAHITEAVVTLDADRRVIGLNHAAEVLSGWTAEEAIGSQVDEVIPRQPLGSSLAEVYHQLDTQGGWRGDLTLLRRDGTEVPVEATGAVIRDAAGQVVLRIGVLRDISQRKQAEAQQAAAQAEIRRLYERAEDEIAERRQADTQLSTAIEKLRQQGERLRILHEIDQAILAARSPGEVAGVAAEGLLRAIDAARVVVSLWQPSGETFEVLAWAGLAHPHLKVGTSMAFEPWSWLTQVRGGQAAFDDDMVQQPDPTPEGERAAAQGIRSHVALPLIVGGQPIGHLDISRSVTGRLLDEELALAQQIADSLAVALHHARLDAEVQDRRQQLQALSRRLVDLQEQERRALSRDLHDTSGQSITALNLGLGALRRAADCSGAIRARVDELIGLTDTVSEDLHRLVVEPAPGQPGPLRAGAGPGAVADGNPQKDRLGGCVAGSRHGRRCPFAARHRDRLVPDRAGSDHQHASAMPRRPAYRS